MKVLPRRTRRRWAASLVACAILLLFTAPLAAQPPDEATLEADGLLDLNADEVSSASLAEPQLPAPHAVHGHSVDAPSRLSPLQKQTREEADAKSWGCVQCHQDVGDMHDKETVKLGCIDCHGGDPEATDKWRAHVHPLYPDAWPGSANPVRSYTLLNHESPEFIRFVNPGDLRVAQFTCGECHPKEVLQVRKSMMTHGCMLWGAALYNNGSVPFKQPRYGESYSMHGTPQRMQNVPPPTPDDISYKGIVPFLDPLPRFEVSQPGNVLRIFERGGRFAPEVGIPERIEEPGRPRQRLSNRGLGTLNRTDPVFIGLQKTRLLDPTLNFLGTNDHPGDYRSSGCSACHVVYANDRSPVHSGPYSVFGNRGQSFSGDPTIPKDESGHPITHKFVVAPPTSQCIVCHVHPGTNVLNTYLGYMWWDNETDGELMYPKHQKDPTAEEFVASLMSNPDETAARGKWSDPEFLRDVVDLNPYLKHTQFADFHGHGWVFRAVYKRDRKGNLLDYRGDVAGRRRQRATAGGDGAPERRGTERSASSARARRCITWTSTWKRGCTASTAISSRMRTAIRKLYGEVRAACEIQCIDCHGTITELASLQDFRPRVARMAAPISRKSERRSANGCSSDRATS